MLGGVALAVFGVICLVGPILIAYCLVNSLAWKVQEMDKQLQHIRNCPRCGGFGWITDRSGERDECPACHGGGRRLLPGEEW
jgi:hypothetical protein